jgi:putative copper export protein
MADQAHTALQSDWVGNLAMVRMGLNATDIVRLARQARREVTAYQRRLARCAHLAPVSTIVEGSV